MLTWCEVQEWIEQERAVRLERLDAAWEWMQAERAKGALEGEQDAGLDSGRARGRVCGGNVVAGFSAGEAEMIGGRG